MHLKPYIDLPIQPVLRLDCTCRLLHTISSDLKHLAILGWVDCGIPSHELYEHFEDAGLTAVSWGLENPHRDRSVFLQQWCVPIRVISSGFLSIICFIREYGEEDDDRTYGARHGGCLIPTIC